MDRKEASKLAEELVGKMTLEEKASQLRYDSPAIPRLGIPAYNWWNEALHGVARAGTATVFPQAIAMAAAFDEELMEKIASAIADEGRAKYNEESKRNDRDIYKGLTFWSPNVNIFRDPRWGRGHETYGEDPYLTSRLGVRFIEGLQGKGEYLKTAACAKHFAVHSGPEAVRHEFNAVASEKDMEETYLPAFEACVKEAGVEAVMGAYNRTNGEVCCGSPTLQKILRERWGFKGHFVSDCWAVKDFHEHHKVTETPEESVKLALENGTDVNCGCTYLKILDAVDKGLLDEKYITQSAIRLFTTRYLLGMFTKTEYDDIDYSVVGCRSHLELAEKSAVESVVLLKNDGILPLSNDDGSIKIVGVIGPNADSRKALIGNYHGTASRYITVLEGIEDICEEKGIRVLYSQGSDLSEENVEPLSGGERGDRISEAETVAEYSDVVILVTGLDETLEGEEGDTGNAYFSGDKEDLELPASQRELLDTVLEMGKKVILINMSGSAINLSEAQERADAVLQGWYPGARGGKAIADILFGKYSPSGKLPVTFYESCDDLPQFEDYSMENRTYRYYSGRPLYPFGYGLTYGDCRAEKISVIKASAEDGAEINVTVKNYGPKTEDVLQLYIKAEDTEWAPLNPALCEFRRVNLGKDEKREICLKILPRGFTTVDDRGKREIRGSKFSIYAGFSQPDERSEELTGIKTIKTQIEI
ncbi:MAG: glycoside hydrolase family 3 C-terminal domain-containing protein [Lachnospiraceae bacterium]|nr:glycoside hydrolase family 3 C-terminal domain-containing protein [Lachnospiraceae bacterium]